MALRLLVTLVGSASVLFSLPAGAQTWAHGRSTPGVRELVAVDLTGEPSWLFGAEDIAADGSGNFNAAEQAADVRSAYAAIDDHRLWLRVYVSARSKPDTLRAFLFVDADDNPSTGGPARAPLVDLALDSDVAGAGGYEVVLAWTGISFVRAWRWTPGNGNSLASGYDSVNDLDAFHAEPEAGIDLDPLRLNATENGYIQLALDFEPLQLSVSCDARLLFRAASGNLRDSDVGRAGPCVPGDTNDNGVADVAETDASCSSDSQCPAGGSCDDGRCVAPALVIAPGEVVQGGALTCAVSRPFGDPDHCLDMAALGALLAASRLRRRRRGPGAC